MTPRTLRARALEGLLAGAGGGAVAAALEAGGTLWLVSGTDRQLLLLQIVAVLVPSGACLGAVAAVGWELLGRLAAGLRRLPAAWAQPVLVAVLASPTCATIGYALFSGGHMRSLAVRPVLIPATTILLVAGVAISARWAAGLVARAPAMSRWRLRAAVLGLTVLSTASYLADLMLFRRLYGYLHAALGVVTFAPLAVAAACLLSLRARPPGRRAIAAVLALCAGLATVSLVTFDRSQNVRAVAFDRTATLRTALRALQSISGGEDTTPRLSRAERRALYEREARARAAAGRYAGLPGANIVLLTADALRADQLGAYGNRLGLSPNLDRLAASGVRFEHAYCAAPHSSFSLSSLHTGEYLQESVELGRDEPRATIADALNDAGYVTAAFYTRGIFHTDGERLRVYDERRFGFSIADHGNRVAEALTDRGIEEIDRLVSRGEPKFFLWLHYFDTHEPYKSTELGDRPFDRYRAEIKHVDREIARFLRHAGRTLGRDTIFVLSADHGEEFKEHGGHYHGSTLYEEQVRVPLIVAAPGLAKRVVHSPVGLVDVAPTLLRLVGVEPPATMRGADLRPLLYAGDGATPPLPAFAAVTHKKMVVRWPWKLVADLQYGTYELYDLEDDPGEQTNLYDRHRDVADELRAEIYGWLDALGRPPAAQLAGQPGGPARTKAGAEPSASERAIALGRLQDKRAVRPLEELVANRRERVELRREAARLVGDLAEGSSIEPLTRALADRDEALRVQAAAALARLGSARGEKVLEEAIYSEDLDLRVAAALALGLLGNRGAVPGLIEGLSAPSLETRQDAIRLLGQLGDARALEPLLEILPEYRTRYLVVIALGMIGDPRAYDTLVDLLGYEDHTDIRAYAMQALGSLGDARAVPLLLQAFHAEPEIKFTAESLVRLGAVGKGAIGGADVAREAAALVAGWGPCARVTRERVRDFLNATSCETAPGQVALLRVRGAPATQGAGRRGVVTWRSHLPAPGRTATLVVRVGARTLDPVPLAEAWEEHRVAVPSLPAGELDVTFTVRPDDGGAPLAAEIDHLLLVPGP
jgi:arylsulfatase A-like enzyme/HEAT repeat protein